jgi:hypothetical protein
VGEHVVGPVDRETLESNIRLALKA